MTDIEAELTPSLLGHYAGAATRLAAIIIDVVLSIAVFNVAIAITAWLVGIVSDVNPSEIRDSNWLAIPLIGWLFIYFWYCYTLSGKTPGMTLLGLRVVRGSGADLDGWHAAIRVITLPLGLFIFGLGYIGIVIGRRRRALQDVFADTAVVYDFDARAARLRFLVRKPIEAKPRAK